MVDIDKLQAGILVVATITNLVLAVLVISKNKKSELYQSIFLFILLISGWILSIFFLQSDASVFWGKLSFIFGSLMPGSFLWFAIAFPDPKKIAKKFYVVPAFLIPFVFTLLPSSYLFQNPHIESGSIVVNNGPLLPIFSFVCVALASMALYVLIKDFLHSKGAARKQFKLVLLGMVLFTVTALSSNVILPAVGIYIFNGVGPVFSLLLTGAITYAILRQNLLDIKILAAEALVASLILITVIQFILSEDVLEYIVNGFIFTVISYSGYLLIKSVYGEVKKRKELQKITTELRAANKRLSELDALKTEFVSMASHELLTPISAIQGYLSMLLDEKIIPLGDKRSEEILRKVHNSSDEVAHLVTDLLNVSRIESGRIVIDKKRFDLNKVIRNSVSEIKIKADRKDLKMELKPIELPEVYADPDRVKRTLINLLGNAIKYTIKGGVTVWTAIEKNKKLGTRIEGEKEHRKGIRIKGDFVVVHIQDTGVGIKNEELPMLFRKFHRIGDWKTRNTGGTGLGLYISKNMVELLGGIIWAESKYGKGSTFSFSIPIAKEK